MKIVLTGSLGHISKPLATELVQKGHNVMVISSKPERQKEIEGIGATAAIGTMEDAGFLAKTFTGADAVYCMEAPGGFFDPNFDIMAHINKLGHNYKEAIERSGVKRVVHLSSIGAHTNKGNGILAFHYNMEKILETLPADVAIRFMRPVGFYYNLLSFTPVIKATGNIMANYGGDMKDLWVAPQDIAAVIAEEITQPFTGRKVRYIASDEISPNKVAQIIGQAIGKPHLKWIVIPDEQQLNAYKAAGMNPQIAKGLVEMNAGRTNGILYEDYYRNPPASLGRIKLKDYATEFAAIYNSSNQ